MTHHLKTWPQYFEQVLSGEKTFELRKQDRNFTKGDVLVLEKYSFANETYTGREVTVEVTYVLNNAKAFGLMDGYVIMGIKIK